MIKKCMILFTIFLLSLSGIAIFAEADSQNPTAIIDTTKGIIKIELYLDKAPITVENFIKLAQDGFYNDMIFHRISNDFMIQAGYLYSDGSTQESPYDNIEFEYNETALHVDGAISMASTGSGVGGSSQFFICDGAQPFLDGSYAVFGVTTEGIEVVRDIADEGHDSSSPAGGGRPYEDIIINSITIEGYQSGSTVNPEEQINLVTDGTDDIIHYTKKDDDFLYNYYYLQASKPDIDVKQITFDIIDNKAVLSMTVAGDIITDNELFAYQVVYHSSTVTYTFTYSDNDLFVISTGEGKMNQSADSFTVNGGTITVVFDKNYSGVADISLYGYAQEYTRANDTLVEHWLDYCPDDMGPNSIVQGGPFSSTNSPGFELILLLFTIALVYFIKRKKENF